MAATAIPRDGVHLIPSDGVHLPPGAVESVDRSERSRWVILESAWPPPFSTGGGRNASREITHAEDPRGSASQGRGLLQAPDRGKPRHQRDSCDGMRAAGATLRADMAPS